MAARYVVCSWVRLPGINLFGTTVRHLLGGLV